MHTKITIASIAAGLAISGAANAAFTVDLGTVRQTSPRPTIVYTGAFASSVSSYVDVTGTRTITSFDLNSIAQQFGGGLALVEIRVRDTGTNTYGNWSPGADIDLVRVVGSTATGTVTMGYQGVVTQHLAETQDTLKVRTVDCDAASGDQHYNSQHFISLGLNGVAWMHFADFPQGNFTGTGSGSGGGSGMGGAGSTTGGAGSGSGGSTTFGGMLVTAGMRLELSEAGLGESYGADLVFEPVAVPAPGAMAVLAGAGLLRRRRR